MQAGVPMSFVRRGLSGVVMVSVTAGLLVAAAL